MVKNPLAVITGLVVAMVLAAFGTTLMLADQSETSCQERLWQQRLNDLSATVETK